MAKSSARHKSKTSRFLAKSASVVVAAALVSVMVVFGPAPLTTPAEAVAASDFMPLDGFPTTNWPVADPEFHYSLYNDPCETATDDVVTSAIHNPALDTPAQPLGKADICATHSGWFIDDDPNDPAAFGDMWICLAIDFPVDTGQTGFWIELNQKTPPDPAIIPPERTTGDVLIGFETLLNKPYDGVPDVYWWDENGGGDPQAPNMVPAPLPLVFEAGGGEKPPGVNFEICINLTDSGLINPPCGFGGFGAYSQPSYSLVNELKDTIEPQPLDASNCATIIVDKVGEGEPDALADDLFTFDLLNEDGSPVQNVNPGGPGSDLAFAPYVNPVGDVDGDGTTGDDYPLPTGLPAYANGAPYHPPTGASFQLASDDNHTSAVADDPAVGLNSGATFYVQANKKYSLQEIAMEADWKFEALECTGDFVSRAPTGEESLTYTPEPNEGTTYPYASPLTWDLTETSDDGTDSAWGAASPIAEFYPAGAGVVTCTFYNEQAAQIDILKDADPTDGTPFEFSVTNDYGSYDAIPAPLTNNTCANPIILLDGAQCSLGLVDADDTGWSIGEINVPSPWVNLGAECIDEDGDSHGTITGDFLTSTPYTASAVNPDYGDDIVCTFTNVIPDTEIGLAKAVTAGPTLNIDGSVGLTYTLVVDNSGNTTLDPVAVTDNLLTTFGAASTFSNIVIDADSVCDTFENTAGYDGGSGDANLLVSPGPVLEAGESCTITLSFDVVPGDVTAGDNFGTTYDNQAEASGTDPFGVVETDLSTDGSLTDPDASGDPGDDSTPTPISFAPVAEIGTAKQVSAGPTLNADGTITLTYEMLVENTGDVTVSDVSLPDDLTAVFGATSTITVDSLAVLHDPLTATSPLTANGAYDGTAANADLLDGVGDLDPGESATTTLTVTVKPSNALPGPYSNQVTATGDDPWGGTVSDVSDDGADPDGNGDGDPSDDSDATVFSMPFTAEIGLAKALTAGPTVQNDGSFAMTYTFVVENTGDVDMDPVQITDDLYATFGGASTFTNVVVDADDAGSCDGFENGSYDGGAFDANLFNATAELPKGVSCTITLSFNVIPGATTAGDNFGSTYSNTATATGTDPYGNVGSDDSADGATPDANGDGDPTDDTSPTNTTFGPDPQMTVTKSAATGPTPLSSGNITGEYTVVVANTGDVNLNDVQVTDDFTATFGAGTTWVSGSVAVTAPSPSVCDTFENGSFDGTASTDLIAGGASSGLTLQPGETCTFTITYEVTPGTPPAVSPSTTTYTNTAAGTSTDPYGNTVGDSGATSADLSITEGLDVAKSLVSTDVNPDATMDFSYDIVLTNPGSVDLSNIQVTDDLAATFGVDAATDFTAGPTLSADPSGCVTFDSNYDGITDTTMLTTGNTLDAGETCTISLSGTVTIGELVPLPPDPGDEVYTNTADAAGDNPYGTTLLGSDTASITVVDSAFTLAMATEKTLTAGFPQLNDDGSFDVSYDVVLSNTGTLNINNLSVTDDIEALYGVGATLTNQTVTGDTACAPNSSWDGLTASDTELVAASEMLTVAEATCTLTVTYTVKLASPPAEDPNVTSFTNTASASGEAPSAGSITTAASDTALSEYNYDPEIGVAKNISAGPTLNNDGTITLTYSILVSNTGNVTANDIQVPDDLEAVFGTGSTITVDALTATTPLTANDPNASGSYDGLAAGDTNLLDGLGDLAPAQSSTITLTVTVLPATALPGPYGNQVTATGTDPYGVAVSDTSVDGTDVDPDADGDPGDNASVTEFTLPFEAEIGVAKDITAGPTLNADGTISLTYSIVVSNTGDVTVYDVQVPEDLEGVYGSGSTITINSLTATTPLTANDPGASGTYDGLTGGDINLLDGLGDLAPTETSTITLAVTVRPTDPFPGPYENSVTATGADPYGTAVSDVSEDGADADPDGDGDPTDNSTPTSYSIPYVAEIGAAKTVTAGPTLNTDGTITLTYDILVENTGDVTLSAVQVPEDLEGVFGTGSTVTVDSLSATAPLTANDPAGTGSYDGLTAGDTNLLDGAGSLLPGESSVITLTVTVFPATALPGPYDNSVVASGTDPYLATVTDVSTDGTDVDPDATGGPGNDSDPTSITVPFESEIGVAKSLTAGPTVNADGSFAITYTMVVENFGTVTLDPVQVADNLYSTFGAASVISGIVVDADDAGLCEGFENDPTSGGTYDGGSSDANLLDTTGVTTPALAPGETCTITLSFNVIPGDTVPGDNFNTDMDNYAQASGTDPYGTVVNDQSVDGADPDANGDGGPEDTSPTTANFGPAPGMTVTKAEATAPSVDAFGNLSGSFTVTVTNTGDTDLDNVQITDDMESTFGTGTVWVSGSVTADSVCTSFANGSYGGTGSAIELVSGGATSGLTLAPTESCVFTINYTVTPAVPPAVAPAVQTYTNTAVGSGTDPYGISHGDTGTATTDASYSEGFTTTKNVTSSTINANGTMDVTYDLVLANTGTVDLANVTLTDDLTTTFGIDAAGDILTGPNMVESPSSCLTLNGSYDGVTDTAVLAPATILTGGVTCTITVSMTLAIAELNPVPPNTGDQVYTNTAVGSADNPYGTTLNSTDTGDVTVVDSEFTLSMSTAKALTTGYPIANADGTLDVSYDITVSNTGTLDIENLVITDDVMAVYGAGSTLTNISVTATAPCAGSTTWDGDPTGDTNLAAPASTLAVGASCTFTVSFTVKSAAAPAVDPAVTTYINTADAGGNAVGIPTLTTTGTDTASADVNYEPELGVAKNISAGPTLNADGTITLTYDILVSNTGDVEVTDIQVPEDLEAVFGAGSSISVDSLSATTPLVANDPAATGSFDGLTAGDTNLLDGTGDLQPGESSLISLAITVFPTTPLPGPYNNTVTATGSDPWGNPVTDDSTDGTDPDPDGDGNPGDDATPTGFDVPFESELGLAKAVTAGPTINADGTTSITYTLNLENSGDVTMDPVQVTDNLLSTFGAASVFSNISVTATSVCAGFENGAYNGSTDVNLIDPTASPTLALAPGDACVIRLAFDVIPGDTAPGDNYGTTYNNTAQTTGTDPYGTVVTDDSVDGLDPDTDGDGDPAETSPTPISFNPVPAMTTDKVATDGPSIETNGNLTGTYEITLSNTGDTNLLNAQITDDMSTTFGTGTAWISGSVTANSVCAGFENGAYTGTGTNIELIAGGNSSGLTLAPGDVCVFTVIYEIDPGTSPAVSPALETYTNTASGSVVDPYGNILTDDGVTSADLAYDNGLDVTKSTVTSTVNADGTIDVSYDIVLTNPGTVDLANVQVTDDLTATFGIDDPADMVSGPTLLASPSGCFVFDASYDGVTDTTMLEAGNTLDAGETCTISLTARVTIGQMNPVPPATGDQSYTNTADGSGDDPYGRNVTGTDTSVVTIVDGAFSLSMSTVKTLTPGFPVFNSDGTIDASYDIVITNTGTLDIANLAATDDIIATYGAGAAITSPTATGTAPCTTNTAWNGETDVDLLDSGITLLAAPGSPTSCTITVTFTVTPPTAPAVDPATTTYTNTASADGNAPGILSLTVTDDDTADTVLGYDPELSVSKDIVTGPTLNIDGTISLTYEIVVTNTGDIDVYDIQIPENLETVYGAGSAITIDTLAAIHNPGTAASPVNANGTFDGVTDINLLDGVGDLEPTESATVTLAITVFPSTPLPGPYANTVTAAGTDPWGNSVSDVSNDGADADPDGDGDPTDNSVPTEFTMPFTAELGVAKSISAGPVLNPDGTITLTYDILVENSGDVTVTDVQIPENLETVYGVGSTITVDTFTVVHDPLTATSPLTANAGFDGTADVNLLDGVGDLEPTESALITLGITVFPTTPLPGPYNNSVTATGSDPYGTPVSDVSNDGTDADPDGDGDPTNNDVPTGFDMPFESEIGLAKALTGGPTINPDGTTSLVYTFTLENSGDVDVANVQVTDNLYSAFGAASLISNIVVDADDASVCETFENGPTTGGSYDGGGADANLLTGGLTLPAGEVCLITVAFDVIPGDTAPGDNFGNTYNNTAQATGTDPYGTALVDDSVDGLDPDTDGDGDPAESSPTPVSFTPVPAMTTDKVATDGPNVETNGNLTGTYEITVTNTGDTNLVNLQIVDSMEVTFGPGTIWVSGSVTATSVCTTFANGSYTGTGTTDELVTGGAASGLTLAPADTCVFTVTYEVDPGTPPAVSPALQTYTNTAEGSTTDPYGNTIADNGVTNSDVSYTEGVDVAKSVVTSIVNADGTMDVSYDVTVTNLGNVDLTNFTITDDLTATFGIDDPADMVTGPALATSPLACLTTNPAYNGVTDTAVLDVGNTLAAGATCTVTLTARFTIGQFVPIPPATGDQSYTNTASASGDNPYGGTLSGSDTADVTIVDGAFTLAMSTVKELTPGYPVFNTDGTIDASYDIVVTNTGTLDIANLAVVDDIIATYGVGSVITGPGVTGTAPCTPNGAWDGETDTALVDAGVTLLAIEDPDDPLTPFSCTLTVTFNVMPPAAPAVDPALTTYTNTATATGNAPGIPSLTVTDDDTADSLVNYDPEIGLAKALTAGPTINPNGTASVTYTLNLENTGDVDVTDIQITDDLYATFGAASLFSNIVVDADNASVCEGFENGPTTGGTYDAGAADAKLFTGGNTLPSGSSCTITLSFDVIPGDTVPGDNFGTIYNNSATTTGNDPWGNPLSDVSVDGLSPDANGDGDPEDAAPTPMLYAPNPVMATDKVATDGPNVETNGNLTGTFTVTVSNPGDVNLYDVQLVDDFSTTFGTGTVWVAGSVTADSVCSGFENTSYTGTGLATELVTGGATTGLTLAPTDSCVFTITYEITPGTPPAVAPAVQTYTNTATGTSTDPYGNTVGDSGQTESDISYVNGLETTKNTVDSRVNADGTLDVTYEIIVSNPGNVDLYDVQITDDLTATFGIDNVADIVSGPALGTTAPGCFSTNPTFDGVIDINVLGAGNTLAAGATCTVTVIMSLTIGQLNPIPPATGDQTYTNTVNVTGTDPYDRDLAAADTADTTIVDGEFTLAMGLTKTLSTGFPVLNDDGSFNLEYSIEITNSGTLNIVNLAATDDVIDVYGIGSVVTNQLVTGTDPCTTNAGWTGDGVIDLLDTGITLLAAEDPDDPLTPSSCSLTISFTVMPAIPPVATPLTSTYTNTALADGNAPGIPSMTVDASDTADANINYNPQLGIAKELAAGPTFNFDGSTSLTYSLVVANLGDVDLDNVQVTDNLYATFGAASLFANIVVDADDAGLCEGFENDPTLGGTYDAGLTDANLFDPLASPALALGVGQSCTVTVSFDVTPGDLAPGDNFGTVYENTATGTATDPYGFGVTDESQDGSDPDPGLDGPGDDDDPTPVSFAPVAQLATTKTISSGPVLNADGTMTLTYSITVANSGDVTVADVQVPDDLEVVFGAGSSITIDGLTAEAPLVANDPLSVGTYDGLTAGDTNLLDGLVALDPGQSSTIDLSITVFSTILLPGPFTNSVTATGTDPWGGGVEDTSNDGTDADPDGDGPGDNSDPTSFELPYVSELGVAKAVTDGPVNNADGSYTLTYQFVVTNLGTVTVSDLQLADDVETTFGPGSTIVIDSLTANSPYLVNSGFNGLTAGDINLLAGTDSLLPAETVTVDLTMTITPTTEPPGPYDNVATATGTDPYGDPVVDDSISGSNPDPDGDGSGAETGPTTVGFGFEPVLGLAKEVAEGPILNTDGSFTITYSLVAANLGDVNVNNVQIVDDLEVTFGAGVQVTVDDLQADLPLVASSTYDGLTDIGLLTGTDTLAVGETSTILLTITVIPAELGDFENQAVITGTDPRGGTVEDESVNGADPSGEDGDPSVESPTPLGLAVEPEIAVAKRVVGEPVANSDGSFRTTFELIVANTGPIELSNVNVTDDLQSQWVGVDFNVVSVASSRLTANSAYNGKSDINLLAAVDILAPGEDGTITLVVDINRPSSGADLENEAGATGDSPYGAATALSANGDDPNGAPSATPLALPAPIALPFVDLPKTGGEALRLLGIGLALMVTGGGLWFVSGRRGRDEEEDLVDIDS